MTQPTSVLLFCGDLGIPLYGPSGSSAHLRGVARALIDRGLRVHVAVPLLHDHRGSVDEFVPAVTVNLARPRRLRDPRLRRETALGRQLLDLALEDFTPDLIWERYSLWCDAGVRVAAATGIRHILEVNAPLSIEHNHPGLEETIWRTATDIVAVSASLADRVRRAGAPSVRHVPNGTDVRGPGDRERTRRELGLEGPVLGFVGSMKPWHGTESLPLLLDALPHATALVVGTGPSPPPRHPRLRHVGRAEPARLPHLLAAMDVGLAPYGPDAPDWYCPLKVLDYLAAGVPVVASDLGDSAHLLRTGGGEVLPRLAPDTVLQWVRAVRRQLKAPRVPRRRPWSTVVEETLKPPQSQR